MYNWREEDWNISLLFQGFDCSFWHLMARILHCVACSPRNLQKFEVLQFDIHRPFGSGNKTRHVFYKSSPLLCSCLLVLPVPFFRWPCCRMGRTSRAYARFVWNFLGPRLLPRYPSAFLMHKSPGRYASNCDLAKMFKCFDELCRTLCKNRSWLYWGLMTNHAAFFRLNMHPKIMMVEGQRRSRNIMKLFLLYDISSTDSTTLSILDTEKGIVRNSSIDAIKINQQASIIDKLDLTIHWHTLSLPSWSTSRL